MTEQPTCLKNYANPSCIYLYLKNCTKHFQSTLTLETGLSDFHKLPLKLNMKKFHLILYKIETIKILTLANFLRNYNWNLVTWHSSLDFRSLKICLMELLNKITPLKTKFLRANHSKFVTKEVSKAIMLRTKLRNKFLKKKTLESRAKYNKQRNICVSLIKKQNEIITKI